MSDPNRRRRRKLFFIAILLAVQLIIGLALVGGLIYSGVISPRWAREFQTERANRLAASKDRRVLIVGDSFLTWWDFEHHLREDLVDLFQQHDVGVRVAAFGGFGPIEYRHQVETIAPDFKPHLILVFSFVGNDLTDVQYRANREPRIPGEFAVTVPTPRPHSTPSTEPSGDSPGPDAPPPAAELPEDLPPGYENFSWDKMRERGISEELIKYAINRLHHPRRMGAEYVNPYLLQTASNTSRLLADNLLVDHEGIEKAWEWIEDEYDQIFEVAREIDATVCVVALPEVTQVGSTHDLFYTLAKQDLDPRFRTESVPQDRLGEITDRGDALFIDTLPGFRDHYAQNPYELLYMINDSHFNEAGFMLAFDIVRSELLDEWLAQGSVP